MRDPLDFCLYLLFNMKIIYFIIIWLLLLFVFFRQSLTPTRCHSPDSIMSTGSASEMSDLSRLSGYSGFSFRIPEKLQIVKPMEGRCYVLLKKMDNFNFNNYFSMTHPAHGHEVQISRPL